MGIETFRRQKKIIPATLGTDTPSRTIPDAPDKLAKYSERERRSIRHWFKAMTFPYVYGAQSSEVKVPTYEEWLARTSVKDLDGIVAAQKESYLL